MRLLSTTPAPDWRKNRASLREGFKDLAFLPRGRTAWNSTLSALAYSVRRNRAGAGDLAKWATMHGCPASARCAELGVHALVLWHGTSAKRAERIRERGLVSKGGVWAAYDPRISHGFTRSRATEFEAGSAMVVLVIDDREIARVAEPDGPHIVRFFSSIAPECVEYILYNDRIDFLGEKHADGPKPWASARFKRQDGQWVPLSKPPVRFDDEHEYATLDEWLTLSVTRILTTLGAAAAIEFFSPLYATLRPWDALEHRMIFDTLDRLCGEPRLFRGPVPLFKLRHDPGAGNGPGHG